MKNKMKRQLNEKSNVRRGSATSGTKKGLAMKKINNTMYGLVVAMMLTSTVAFAQEIDQERMERDLKIAENILGTLSNNDRNIFSISNSIESSYIPEYGVIFSLPQNSLIVASRSGQGVSVISEGGSYTYTVTESDDHSRAKEVTDKVEASENYQSQLEEKMTLFLVDYADLIGQLKPSDRIVINVKDRSNYVWSSGSNVSKRGSNGKTAEILKSDLIAYKQGKATRDATIGKITFNSNGNEKTERDLELFSSILGRVYAADLAKTYYSSSRNINYERLEGLGVIYSMRVYSSTSENGLHTIRTTGESGLSQQERNAKVNAMYPEFEKAFKENILDYGRTIRSLGPSEMLIVKVRLTECKGCGMPRNIELKVKSKTLQDFNSGKLNRDNALKAIDIKKTSN